jgi:hypothetical protein
MEVSFYDYFMHGAPTPLVHHKELDQGPGV